MTHQWLRLPGRSECWMCSSTTQGSSGGRIGPSEATADHMRAVYETNVFGPVRVLNAFIPLLENSPAPVIVNVSSGVGSLNLAADPEGPRRGPTSPSTRRPKPR